MCFTFLELHPKAVLFSPLLPVQQQSPKHRRTSVPFSRPSLTQTNDPWLEVLCLTTTSVYEGLAQSWLGKSSTKLILSFFRLPRFESWSGKLQTCCCPCSPRSLNTLWQTHSHEGRGLLFPHMSLPYTHTHTLKGIHTIGTH